MVKTLSELYLEARRAFLTQEDAQSASLMARELLMHVTGRSQQSLLAQGHLYASQEDCDKMAQYTRRLLEGEPLAYILGQWDFYGLTFYVDKNVLIPRDDTCAVAGLAIEQALFLETGPRILDLCTGSGCIGIAIAHRVKDARVTLADISKEALTVAKKNVNAHKLTGRVSCIQADALAEPASFLGKFDMIVSNPPYITGQEMLELPPSVKDFEPHLALHGGEDGLVFYRSVADRYRKALKPGGYLCFEFGMGQGNDVCKILEENEFKILKRVNDYNDRERAVLAQLRED